MKRDEAKKIGRRGAGSWGRPGSRALKKAASKAVRRARKQEQKATEKDTDMTVTEKTQVTTIDMTPTWEQQAAMLVVLAESGNAEGRAYAVEEIKRMGRIIDILQAEIASLTGGT